MYRVLLVEDEEIIRKGIRYSVPWEAVSYTHLTLPTNSRE